MSDQSNETDRLGSTDHSQHRAPDNEGVGAPMAQATGEGPPQISIFDGQGNETVVVVAEDEEGRMAQGTGATAEEAEREAKKPGDLLGEGFSPGH